VIELDRPGLTLADFFAVWRMPLSSRRMLSFRGPVAAYVDDTITDVMQGGQMVESHKAAILAALRIAGELFEARDETARLAAQMRELSDEIRPWLPPAKRHD
jgi:hypothetical protein